MIEFSRESDFESYKPPKMHVLSTLQAFFERRKELVDGAGSDRFYFGPEGWPRAIMFDFPILGASKAAITSVGGLDCGYVSIGLRLFDEHGQPYVNQKDYEAGVIEGDYEICAGGEVMPFIVAFERLYGDGFDGTPADYVGSQQRPDLDFLDDAQSYVLMQQLALLDLDMSLATTSS